MSLLIRARTPELVHVSRLETHCSSLTTVVKADNSRWHCIYTYIGLYADSHHIFMLLFMVVEYNLINWWILYVYVVRKSLIVK